MKTTVCIGSSCHLKGSREIVEQLQALVAEHKLEDKIELSGAFCMGNCTNGVSINIDGKLYSLQPENTINFFENEMLRKL